MTGEMQILVAFDAEVERGMVEALATRDPRITVLDYLELGGPSSSGLGEGDALIVAVAEYTAQARDFVAGARRQCPARPIVLLCPVDENGDVADAFDSGVDDIVPLPAEPASVVDLSLARALVFALDKAVMRKRGAGVPKSSSRRNVICVLGLKGGSGKTFTSTNLGVALAAAGRSVAMIDLDLQFGDVALAMGLSPERTIYDLARAGGSLDAEKLEGFLVEHRSGAKVLLAPVRPDQAAIISVPFLTEVQELLASMFDYVVVDTSPSFSPEVISAVDISTDILLVAMRDTLSLKNARLGLETLERMDYDRGRVRILLNRANSNVGIEREDILAILGRDVDALVPSHRDITRSVNQGTPIVMLGNSEPARAFHRLAALYADGAREATAPLIVPEASGTARKGMLFRRPARSL